MIRLVSSAAVLALLAGCGEPAPQTPAATPVGEVALSPPAELSPDQMQAAAFQAAWGSPPPANVPATNDGGDASPLTYTKATLVPLGGDRFALVSEGQGGDGHVSAGALAIHYLTRTSTGFTRTGAWPNIVDGGTFGAPPEWTIRTDLTPAPTLVATGGGTWQGYSCSWSSLVELTPERAIVRVDAIPVAYDSGGAREEGEEEMEGAILAGRKGQSFDVRYTGDRNVTVSYALQGDTYKATSAPDLLTC